MGKSFRFNPHDGIEMGKARYGTRANKKSKVGPGHAEPDSGEDYEPFENKEHPNDAFSREYHKDCKKCAKCGKPFDGSNDDHTHTDHDGLVCDTCATKASREDFQDDDAEDDAAD